MFGNIFSDSCLYRHFNVGLLFLEVELFCFFFRLKNSHSSLSLRVLRKTLDVTLYGQG